jgi:hypothetical protein
MQIRRAAAFPASQRGCGQTRPSIVCHSKAKKSITPFDCSSGFLQVFFE